MRDKSQCSFVGQNLRNRSFAGQDLRGADFSHADLRGCNFRKADLTGANFSHARLGRSRFQVVLRATVTLGVALAMTDAVSRMVFGALGKTWEDPAWLYVLLLQGVLASIGVTTAIALFAKHPLRIRASWAAGLLNGALVGFFYGGYLYQSNPGTAAYGAIMGMMGMGILLWAAGNQPWLRLGITTASLAATYGLTFFVGMWAISSWSTVNGLFTLGLALSLSAVGLSTLWLTGRQLLQLLTEIRTLPGTFFQGADLKTVNFEAVIQKHTDDG